MPDSFIVAACLYITPMTFAFDVYVERTAGAGSKRMNFADIGDGHSRYYALVMGCTEVDVTIN